MVSLEQCERGLYGAKRKRRRERSVPVPHDATPPDAEFDSATASELRRRSTNLRLSRLEVSRSGPSYLSSASSAPIHSARLGGGGKRTVSIERSLTVGAVMQGMSRRMLEARRRKVHCEEERLSVPPRSRSRTNGAYEVVKSEYRHGCPR